MIDSGRFLRRNLQALPSSNSAVVNTPAENGMESFARLQVRLMLATVIVSVVATLFASLFFDLFVLEHLIFLSLGCYWQRKIAESM